MLQGTGKKRRGAQDGKQSEKAKKDMAHQKELYGLKPGLGYSDRIPAEAIYSLNQREKDCLDVLYASLEVARLANQFMPRDVGARNGLK